MASDVLLNNSVKQSSCFREAESCCLINKLLSYTELESSLMCAQKLATGRCFEAHESGPYINIPFIKVTCNVIFPSALRVSSVITSRYVRLQFCTLVCSPRVL
jgi:hypothetical protein